VVPDNGRLESNVNERLSLYSARYRERVRIGWPLVGQSATLPLSCAGRLMDRPSVQVEMD
jgi:hypothetical protein